MQNIIMLIRNIISYEVFCSFIYLSANNRIIHLSKTHSAKTVFKFTAFYMRACMDVIPMNVKIGEKYYQKFCLWLTQGNINLLYLNGAIHCRKQCNSHQRKSQRPFSKHKQTFKDDIIFASAGHYTLVNGLIYCFEH